MGRVLSNLQMFFIVQYYQSRAVLNNIRMQSDLDTTRLYSTFRKLVPPTISSVLALLGAVFVLQKHAELWVRHIINNIQLTACWNRYFINIIESWQVPITFTNHWVAIEIEEHLHYDLNHFIITNNFNCIGRLVSWKRSHGWQLENEVGAKFTGHLIVCFGSKDESYLLVGFFASSGHINAH